MKAICDLHTHSVLSKHAYSSVTENIEYANSIGLKYYGISEHQEDPVGVGIQRYAFTNLRILPRKYKDTYILRGAELNILDDGKIDILDKDIKYIDYGIASMHGYIYDPQTHTKEQNTENYLKVLDNPLVKILGHIDSASFPCDYEKVLKKVVETNKLIEINNASLNPEGYRKNADVHYKEILSILKRYNYPVIMNTDAHIKYLIGDFGFTEKLLDEIDFPKELILNYNEELFLKYFGDIIKED